MFGRALSDDCDRLEAGEVVSFGGKSGLDCNGSGEDRGGGRGE